MEVHAHTHTARKKWTHYFWEFLMLFLAVTLGFFAENQREHYIENQREKKYIHSLVTDLKTDTAEISWVIAYNIQKFYGLDTLINQLNVDIQNDDEKSLYFLNSRYAGNIFMMIFSDGTIRQLLNSGNLRLVKSLSAVDSIMNYYGQSKDGIIKQAAVYDEMSRRLIIGAEDIFDQSVSPVQMRPDRTFYRDRQIEKMRLMTHDKQVLKKYAQAVATSRGFLSVYLSMLFEMQIKANNLLTFLKKEYHLQ